jgi:hypothetical protein
MTDLSPEENYVSVRTSSTEILDLMLRFALSGVHAGQGSSLCELVGFCDRKEVLLIMDIRLQIVDRAIGCAI